MNSWDQRFETSEYFYGTEPNDFLKERAESIRPGGDVLCLAEGEGRNAVFLASKGYRVTAVDQSKVGLKKLENLARERDVKVTSVAADLNTFRIDPGFWDGIVSIWVHLPAESRAELHRRCCEGLKAGGVLILEAYTPRQLKFKTGGPTDPNMLPTLAGLKAELKGLQFEHAVEIDREIHEGIGHNGMSAVVRVLARKI